jgi:hypothetical protein
VTRTAALQPARPLPFGSPYTHGEWDAICTRLRADKPKSRTKKDDEPATEDAVPRKASKPKKGAEDSDDGYQPPTGPRLDEIIREVLSRPEFAEARRARRGAAEVEGGPTVDDHSGDSGTREANGDQPPPTSPTAPDAEDGTFATIHEAMAHFHVGCDAASALPALDADLPAIDDEEPEEWAPAAEDITAAVEDSLPAIDPEAAILAHEDDAEREIERARNKTRDAATTPKRGRQGKLTREIAIAIRSALKEENPPSRLELAAQLDVHPTTISDIVAGRLFRD